MPNDKLQKINSQQPGQHEHNQNLFSITELARELSISTRTIRFYESKGLISPDRVGGNRIFQNRDRVRLLLILRGKRLGFTLKDISEYLALYDADETRVSQVELLQNKVDQRLKKLNGQLHDLQTTIEELQQMRAQTAERLRQGNQ
ncbi:MAG: MerR family DNA-binding transcriptional regulator [Devosiaceae bacterium]|nr:MerR family DNA-binding transcriptional regulator [Devosiaceae bacterium]